MKLPIKRSIQFAGDITPEGNIAQFGSLAAAAPQFSADPDIIQSLPAWRGGWSPAVVGNKSPAMQDMVAAQYVFSYLLTQLQQRGGVLEWNPAQDYYADSVTTRNGLIYISIFGDPTGNTPANIGHDPAAPDGANYWTPVNMRRSGPTAQRPQNPPQGFVYLDTTIWQELVWANNVWVTTFGGPGMVIDVDAPDLNTALTYYPGWSLYTPGVRRVIAGADPATLGAYAPGAQRGEETHALTTDEMPSHTHTFKDAYYPQTSTSGENHGTNYIPNPDPTRFGARDNDNNNDSLFYRNATTDPTGAGAPHNVMQPTLYLFKLIKTIPGTPTALRPTA